MALSGARVGRDLGDGGAGPNYRTKRHLASLSAGAQSASRGNPRARLQRILSKRLDRARLLIADPRAARAGVVARGVVKRLAHPVAADDGRIVLDIDGQIGRASCRERV